MQRTMIAQTPEKVSEEVTIKGWVETKRDHGKITFVDVRDRTGTVQAVGFKMMGELTTESIVSITGMVKARPESMVNSESPTGAIEIEVTSYEVLNQTSELPFPIEGDGLDIKEEVRLKYRYLDLRRERLRRNLLLRSEIARAIRMELYQRKFIEVETPMLTKSTKEGSRDFIVPSRFQPGKFYALPQSPQQYKQLLMTAGVERYFQFARCIRDEDLRADRGFEHTQVDLEMSFMNQQEVMQLVESVVKASVEAVGGTLRDQSFPVISYQDALERYGDDKFDMRTEAEKEAGVLAFAWVVNFPFFKQVDTDDAAEVADSKSGWTFTHNPFSQPQEEYLEDHLAGQNLDQIRAYQYDLVCNGYEIGGGSIRAHDPAVLRATFEIMGYSAEQIEESIGHMLRAFELGTPPHGGIALGLDRLAMILAGETSLKEVIPFPMSSTGRTAVMDAPSPLPVESLHDFGLTFTEQAASAHDAILERLKNTGVTYKYYAHEPVMTSEEAQKIRGEGELSQGAKALVLDAGGEYVMAVVPGDRRLNIEALQHELGAKKVAMASRDSVEARTGVEVGGVPPFGSVFGFKTFVDEALLENEEVVFNIGRRDRSVMMRSEDYIAIEQPTVLALS